MTSRIFRLAVVAALVSPLAARAQATGSPPFLTGACVGGDSLVDLEGLVAEPEERPSLQPMDSVPVPPAWMGAKDHDTKVLTAFVVDTNGAVRPNTVTIMSSSSPALSRWACALVPLMRFNAARQHGRAVATQVLMPFDVRPPSDSMLAATSTRAYLEVEVEKQVTLNHVQRPQYPLEARNEHVQGFVLVQFVVDTTGHPEMNTFHVLSATDIRFIQAARQSIEGSTYHPAEIHGRKVRQMVKQPFTFALDRR